MNFMNTSNETIKTSSFTRCLGIYHLLEQPTGVAYATYISVIVVLSLFSIFSTLGNGLIIYVYIKQKSLQRTNTLLLVCLAFLDFVSAVLLEPLYVVRLFSEIFGFTSCIYILIVRRLLEYLRPISFITLALITIERYLALFKAITHRRMVTKRRLLYVVLVIWFVWFLIICIRSVFPKLTTAFYTFFTFVAFSLLVGNLVMYVKIGKLARFHSRRTRVSTAPGSLSVGYENPRSIGPSSTKPAVIFSKTEDSVNYVLDTQHRSPTKTVIQAHKNVVTPTAINMQPHKEGEQSKILPADDEDMSKERNGQKTCQNQPRNENGNAETLNAKAFDKTTVSIEEKNEIMFKSICKNETSSKATNNTEVTRECCKESLKNTRGENKSNQVGCETNNNNSFQNSQTVSFTRENTHKEGNIEILARGNDQEYNITQSGSVKKLLKETQSSSKVNTTVNSFESTTQDERKSEVKTAKVVKISTEFENAGQNKTVLQVKTQAIELKNDEAINSVRKINATKRAQQESNRSSFKNTAKVLVETKERNATWTVFYIVAILTVCYLPISTILLYLSFQNEPDEIALFILIPIADTVALFNALVNPFVYCFKNRKMRTAVQSVLKRTRSNL